TFYPQIKREPEAEVRSLNQRDKLNLCNAPRTVACSLQSRPEDNAMLRKFFLEFFSIMAVATFSIIGLSGSRNSVTIASAQNGQTFSRNRSPTFFPVNKSRFRSAMSRP